MPIRGKDSYSIQSVENALNVLEALCEEEGEVRVSRLSEKLGMNKTSVFRLLATFENRGYVERGDASGKYRLGLSAYEMGQKFLLKMGVLRKARPSMDRLVRECNEAVYLAIRKDREVLFLDVVDTPQQVRIVSLVGRRYPLEGTAAGKIFLAVPPGVPYESKNPQGDLPAGCSSKDLEEIQTRGSAEDTGTLGDGISSIAVPILEVSGKLAGVLCIVGPDFRMSPDVIERELLPRLKDAGRTVSSKLGYMGHHPGRDLY
ncbi:transcriptional regulator, IclR family [Desulfuromonas soudanensis]|uniref:Transcriptional regulator, IclR family n=1 Tax=Desulfuromonas soudanensis TaxID=1603606 RepID=A0A0M3QG71_9BACT|nr:IclR family transcriptional regulator [Desulfuromonas soudanensis]ALC17479.1 transcriptional regulator, IclR family [Desulfuromonas soudanensis]